MFQVLVKTTAVMQGAYTYLLEDRAAADKFVRRADVWWYHYPAEHEDWDWRRGGAWKPSHLVTQDDLAAEERAPEGSAPLMNQVIVQEDDDDDDGRW